MFGVEETENNYEQLEDIVLKVFNTDMNVPFEKYEIEYTNRFGKKGTNPRPISVTVSTHGKKIKLLQNKKRLENCKYYINDEFPPKVLAKRRELQNEVNLLKAKGTKAVIKYDKLVILNEKSSNHLNIAHRTQKRNLSLSPEENRSVIKDCPVKQTKKKNKNDISSFFTPRRDVGGDNFSSTSTTGTISQVNQKTCD